MPRASPPQPAALGRELLHQVDFVGALQVGDGAKTTLRQPLCVAGPTPKMIRPVSRPAWRGPHLGQASQTARLVHVGCDLGQELVAGQPDRNRDADVALDLLGKARQHFGGDHAVNALGAGKIEKRLVDRSGSTSGVSASMAWRTSRPT